MPDTPKPPQPTPAPVQQPPPTLNDIKPATKIPEKPLPDSGPEPKANPAAPKTTVSGVSGAVFATVIIVVLIAALIVYAYLKSK